MRLRYACHKGAGVCGAADATGKNILPEREEQPAVLRGGIIPAQGFFAYIGKLRAEPPHLRLAAWERAAVCPPWQSGRKGKTTVPARATYPRDFGVPAAAGFACVAAR